jgi:D-glycero-D-manno-heptose 1,7-bisphosphate phosphatase
MRLVLLDRDGVLNEVHPDSVKSPAELIMIPGAAAAVAKLNEQRIKVAVVTNQSVVGRGVIDTAMLDRIHDSLHQALREEWGWVDAVFFCPDHPDNATERRKPGSAMLQEALVQFSAKASETPIIGDQLTDLEAGAALGCPRILVRTGRGSKTQAAGLPLHVHPVSVYSSLAAAVDALIAVEV